MTTETTQSPTSVAGLTDDLINAILYDIFPPSNPTSGLQRSDSEKVVNQLRNPDTMGRGLYISLARMVDSARFLSQFTDAEVTQSVLRELLARSPWVKSRSSSMDLHLKSHNFWLTSIEVICSNLNDKERPKDKALGLYGHYVSRLLIPVQGHLEGRVALDARASEIMAMLDNPTSLTPDLILRLQYIARFPEEIVVGTDMNGEDVLPAIVKYVKMILAMATGTADLSGEEETHA